MLTEKMMGYSCIRMFLLDLASAIILSKERLDVLDAACGDGDLGVGMHIGFSSVKGAVEQKANGDIGDLLDTAGRALLSSVGGASGALFGTLFIEMGKAAGHKSEIGLKDLSNMFGRSLEKIRQRGGAQLGDKTLIDALGPAVLSLNAAQQRDLDLEMALHGAYEAASAGAESTKNLVAKQGKARYLGDQTLGHLDPGAEMIRIMFETLWRTYQSIGTR
jgi:dihydroxyacetone kinase-like protein